MSYLRFALLSTVTTLVSTPVYAQQAEPVAENPEPVDIVVTAEKRTTTLQKTAAAVTAIAGDDLNQKGIASTAQLANVLPSTRIGQAAGSPAIFVRGIGQLIQSANLQPAVAVNFAGAYVPREMVLSSLFDLSSVEALPGPQSTIYGSNAIGGTINLNPKRPVFDLGVEGMVEVGNYSNARTQLAVNVPVSSMLAVRASGDLFEHDGYFSNGAGEQQDKSGRLSALFQPTENFSVYVVGTAFKLGGLPAPYVNNPLTDPSNPWRSDRDPTPTYQRSRGESLAGEIKFENGPMSVTYIPSYVRAVNDRFIYASLAPDYRFFGRSETTTHELRFASRGSDGSDLLAGLYYSSIRTNSDSDFFFAPLGNLGIRTIQRNVVQETYAAFGQYRLQLNDVFAITAGGRYSSNKAGGAGTRIVRRNNVVISTGNLGDVSKRWEHFDWKVAAEAQITPANLVYANVQTGYLMGGPSLQVVGSAGYNPLIKPQKLTGYTAGSKNRFLNGAVQANLEAYYYDYRDYQVSANAGGVPVFYNAPKASVYGVQLDSVIRFARNTTLSANIGWMRAEFKSFNNPVVGNLKGFQLPGSPNLTGTISFTQGFDLASGGRVEGQAQTHFESSSWSTFNHLASTRTAPFSTTDLQLTFISAEDRIRVSAFVRNVGNVATYNIALAGTVPGPASVFLNPPRTYGARLAFDF